MRRWTLAVATALLGVSMTATPRAHADDEDDNPSANDLLVFNPRRPFSKLGADHASWSSWWYANRGELLAPSYRALGPAIGPPTPAETTARDRGRDALLAALASKHVLVSSEAALALGRCGDARDVATLAPFVADRDLQTDRRLHRYAALGMGLLGKGDAKESADARRVLLGALDRSRGERDRYEFFHANCAYALAMRGDEAALPDLADIRRRGLEAVDNHSDIHTEVLGPIVFALGVLGGEGSIPEIEDHLKGGRSAGGGTEDTAEAACQALARVGGEKARTILRRAAADPRERVRRLALQALGAVTDANDDATAKVLGDALAGEKDPECRWMAAVSLARSGHASAEHALVAAFKNGEAASADRACFAIALGLLARARNGEVVSRTLFAALEDSKDEDETCGLATACGLARVVAARGRLGELVEKGRSPTIVSYAAYALGLVGADDEQRKTLHAEVARRGDFMVRREASLALGMLRDATIVQQLRDIAGDASHPDVERAGAAVSLGRVGGYSDVDFFVKLLDDRGVHEQLRACVVQGLGLLLDRDEGKKLARVAAESHWFVTVLGRLRWPPVWDVQHLVD